VSNQGGNSSFGFKGTSGQEEGRSYHLSDAQWCDVFVFMYACVQNGACPTMYTSADGNALCVSVKHGKTEAKYWIGPDDDAAERISRMYREWGVLVGASNPFDRVLTSEIERERAYIESSGGKGSK